MTNRRTGRRCADMPISRMEFNALVARVSALEHLVTPVPSPDPPTPPTPPVPIPIPTPVSAGIPLVGRSGLRFNSLVFRADPLDADTFGTLRGTPVDGLLYFPGRDSWRDMQWHPDGQAERLGAGQIVVTSLPHAPEPEGTLMNVKGANDAYKLQQRQLGASIASAGLNAPTHVLRVDWECNGDWYPWSANNGGPGALKMAIRNFVTNVRAGGASKVKFDLCFNKGPSQTGHDFDVFPGADVIDVIGIDQYDMWEPARTSVDWEREMAKTPSIRSVAAFATANGIQWSIDECGNTHGDVHQGGDNPAYWQFLHTEILASVLNCAWHDTYDDPGSPATLHHDFASNPNSWATYRRLWTP